MLAQVTASHKWTSLVKELVINKQHEMELHMLAPDDTMKGQVQGIPTDLAKQETVENIKQDDFEVIKARRLGEMSQLGVLTFGGKIVPRCVWIGGCNCECRPHRTTVPLQTTLALRHFYMIAAGDAPLLVRTPHTAASVPHCSLSRHAAPAYHSFWPCSLSTLGAMPMSIRAMQVSKQPSHWFA